MTNWRLDFNPDHLYFITTKAVDYTHLFQRDLVKRLLIDALDCMHLRQQLILYAFVIMPNHIHLIAQFLLEKPFARYYLTNQPAIIPVEDARELML